jgi:riboflavin synthase
VQASSMLDGHIVSGHIDTVWTVTEIEEAEDGSVKIMISFDPQWTANLIPKGSITVNGVSLTVVETWTWRFTIWLIPLTQEITNLWKLKLQEKVNLEFDMIGKYILNYLHLQEEVILS